MKTFLQEVAEKIYQEHPRLEDVTVVFPNRRAALFFRKYLSQLLSRPAFAPKVKTIEDFIAGFSPLIVPEKLVLVSVLFGSYRKVLQDSGVENDSDHLRALENFYFWGDMLLRDFDELDKYLVPASRVFKNLSDQKELEASFDFLTDEQQKFLMDFWGHFKINQSANKARFLHVWRQLGDVYHEFREALQEKGWAYEGMLHRSVAEALRSGTITADKPQAVVFAGFNALTSVEEEILSFFVEATGAKIHWDLDAYYVNNLRQEAGLFFREYQRHPVLGKTFPSDTPSYFQKKVSSRREVNLYGAAQPVAQAKLMSQVLKEQVERGLNPDETLVVLADETLLMPVLHGISGCVGKLNVTMGFPLTSAPFFNFIELLIELQITRKGEYFNHRAVMALLGHPYVVAADAPSASAKRKQIIKSNWVHIPKGYLASEVSLHRTIFQEVVPAGGSQIMAMVDYLQAIVRHVGSLPSVSEFDKEYAFHFHKLFNLLGSVLPRSEEHVRGGESRATDGQGIKSFLRLFRQLARMEKIPFSGEPLTGLQVMGVLETRNLDFKNVFLLSLNEGAFPSSRGKSSYIPHNIRRAYGLPTLAHHDAMYSYLFYRTLQRAENIFLFYCSETDVLGQGEMSRYLQQLLYESGLNIRRHVLHYPIRPRGITPVRIEKNDTVLESLLRLNEMSERYRGISPSALNSYIECRLQFYFRYVARIREADEVEEELDARVLGNFLHNVMENFYKDVIGRKGHQRVEKEDFRDADRVLDGLIDRQFVESYRLDESRPVEYAGQRLVVREVVKRFANRILKMDEEYAPFTIEALERDDLTYHLKIERAPYEAVLGGKIDRVDSKGDVLRIIDYKTGKDELSFDSLDSLFSRDGRRNKAAFQTLLYALMYVRAGSANGSATHQRVVPGLINRMNAFNDDFTFGLQVGKKRVSDVRDMFPEFERKLQDVLNELYDPGQPFDQTQDVDVCRYCAYKHICYRA